MQAIRGVYKNGILELEEKAPMNYAEVIVTFIKDASVEKKEVRGEEALKMLEKYRGRIKRDIDIDKERDGCFG